MNSEVLNIYSSCLVLWHISQELFSDLKQNKPNKNTHTKNKEHILFVFLGGDIKKIIKINYKETVLVEDILRANELKCTHELFSFL